MFLSTNTCDGLGECIKQCPTKAIKLVGGKAFSCLTCGACYKNCPNDAIFINDYGGYVVDKTKCNACGMCMYNCPTNNINIIDGVVYGICSRCGVCANACPANSRVDGFETNEEKQIEFIKSLNVSFPNSHEQKKEAINKEVKRAYFGTDINDCIFCGRCADYCPTEAIKVNNDREHGVCTECRICIDVCPNDSINKHLMINSETCTLCLNCMEACPHDAISVNNFKVNINKINLLQEGTIVSCVNCGLCAEESKNGSMVRIDGKQRYDPTRDIDNVVESHKKSIDICPVSTLAENKSRVIFDMKGNSQNPLKGFCVSCGLCVQTCDKTHARKFLVDTWDGSISDDCIGCGTCVEVCPADAMKFNRGDVLVDLDKCILCGKCSIYCPTDAIPRTTLHKKVIDEGFNIIDQRQCIKCGLCYNACNYEAIKETDDGFVVDEEKCTYCSACVNTCPANSFIFERKFKDSTEGI